MKGKWEIRAGLMYGDVEVRTKGTKFFFDMINPEMSSTPRKR